jgi:hypothetical protein
MRSIVLAVSAAVLLGCSSSDNKATDTTKAAAAAAPAPSIKLADVAGKWNVIGKTATGDTTLVTYELVATADTTGWTINFPKRPPVPAHVTAVGGDSVVIDAGPYESVLRAGVQVTTHSVNHLVGGKLVGSSVAHYNVKTADSVRLIKSEGTRAP